MKPDEREFDASIDDALRHHFSPPAGIGARALARAGLDGGSTDGPPSSGGSADGTPARGGRRTVLPYLAAAALLAAAASLYLRPPGNGPEPIELATASPGAGAISAADCELEGIFSNAVSNADALLEGTGNEVARLDEWDTSLLSQVGPTTCSGEDAVWVVGRFDDPRLENTHLVMCRAGAEAVMLVVPESDCDPGICLPDDGELRVHPGVWNGRDVYEVSRLDESRILSCFGTIPREF